MFVKAGSAIARRARRYLLAGLVASVAAPAMAHPSILLQSRVLLDFRQSLVVRIGEVWTFDKVYSRTLIEQYDTDGDGLLGPAEQGKMRIEIATSLAPLRFFTYVKDHGVDLGPLQPSHFRSRVENGTVVLAFWMDLTTPIDIRTARLSIEIMDPDFIAAPYLARTDPVYFRGVPTSLCAVHIAVDHDNGYYGNDLDPSIISLDCGGWRP